LFSNHLLQSKPLRQENHFKRYPLRVACIDLNKHKIVFWYLTFLKEVLQENNRRFKIVFLIKLSNRLKSFKSLWIYNRLKQNKSKKIPPKFDKILGCYTPMAVHQAKVHTPEYSHSGAEITRYGHAFVSRTAERGVRHVVEDATSYVGRLH
jgi:hypothetical protein